MGVISGLGLILLVLLILVTGKDTFSIFSSLILNFLLLFMTIILISLGLPPLPVALGAGILILALIIFLSPVTTKVGLLAFGVSVVIVLGLVLLILPIQYFGQLQGFGNESNEELGVFSLMIGLSFPQIACATILLSTLGAIAEASIAMASALQTLLQQIPDLSKSQLYQNGRQMGGRITMTALHTLCFGFLGGYLALFVWLVELNYAPTAWLNDKLFIAALASVFVAMIAVSVTVPLTIWAVGHWWRPSTPTH